MSRHVLFMLLALAPLPLGACLRSTSFTCATNETCGTSGRCESTGYCSIPDPACNGNRYVASAGPFAGDCVTTPDGPIGPHLDARVGCPGDFATLPTVTTGHVYKAIAQGRNWMQQKAACTALSANAYLAIPDDATELAAIATLQPPDVWLGIERDTGITFKTVKNMAATFLPWQGGTPDTAGNRNCVRAVSTTEIQTDTCAKGYPAVCECEP